VRASLSHLATSLDNHGWGPATLALELVPRAETLLRDPQKFIAQWDVDGRVASAAGAAH
jgi:hypothetical protein